MATQPITAPKPMIDPKDARLTIDLLKAEVERKNELIEKYGKAFSMLRKKFYADDETTVLDELISEAEEEVAA